MPDSHTAEQRRYNMSRIRSTGTSPETRLGDLLRQMFPQQELQGHPPHLPGKPDWWMPALRIALFSDGCFFHRCPKHFIMPVNNREYWGPKIARNRSRDLEVNRTLRDMGIRPVRIWEHDLRRDLTAARRKVRRAVREASAETQEERPAG